MLLTMCCAGLYYFISNYEIFTTGKQLLYLYKKYQMSNKINDFFYIYNKHNYTLDVINNYVNNSISILDALQITDIHKMIYDMIYLIKTSCKFLNCP